MHSLRIGIRFITHQFITCFSPDYTSIFPRSLNSSKGCKLFHLWDMVVLVVRNLPANAGDTGSIPESGRSPGVGIGHLFQYSCLENAMDRESWGATVHRVTKSQTRLKRLSIHIRQCREASCPQPVRGPSWKQTLQPQLSLWMMATMVKILPASS